MKTYKINVYQKDSIYDEYNYCATFDDYDPTPIDNETPAFAPIGYGDCKYDAMHNLIEQYL